MKNRFLVFLLFLVSYCPVLVGDTFAGKERWKVLTGNNGGESVIYDPESVLFVRPGVFRVWIMGFDKDHSPRKSLEEIDCSNKIYREIEVITEKPGKPALHTFTPSEWRGNERETARKELFSVLCR